MAWLQRGGHLVVSVEQASDVNAVEWLRKLLPAEFSGTTVVQSHGELQQWLHSIAMRADSRPNKNARGDRGATGTTFTELSEDPEFEGAGLPVVTGTLRDGQVLLGTPSAPLAIQGLRGRGRITVLTFSPEREPFASWKNRAWFWTKLADVPSSLYDADSSNYDYSRVSSDGMFGAMIDSKQVRKLPLGWLLLLLVAYLAVIGPIDQWWLKRINRQMLTWITFPCYVVGFSCLIYFIGFYLRAGDLEWNELSVVDVLPTSQLSPNPEASGAELGQGAVLRGQTYCSIYSPVNNHYPLVGAQPYAALRGEFLDNMGAGAGQGARASVVQHGNGFEADAFVSVWTSQLYVSDWLQAAPEPLKVTAALQDGKNWQVSVENTTDHKLTAARIVLGQRVYDLAELPAQKTTTFNLSPDKARTLVEFINSNGNNLRQAAQSRRNSFGNNANLVPDLALGSMAASFASLLNQQGNGYNNFAMAQGLDLTKLAERGQGILLAWDADHSFNAPFNKFSARRSHRNTLLRVVVPITKPAAN